ncbi:MAG: NAD(P)-dependent oxidoreductase, partial [Candidatus Thorarchaeota archaeon]
ANVENLELLFLDNPIEDEFLKHAKLADIIVGWRPSEDLLNASKKLKLFINPGAGVQHHIDPFRILNETRDVVLVNGHGNSYFTAQHATTLLLTLMNRVIPHHNWMVEGKWRTRDSDARSIPLRWKRIGLLGYGAINQKVHKFLSGFDVDFYALKRKWFDGISTPTPIRKYNADQIMDFVKEVDILIIAVPQTKETINLIGKEELELLGKDGLLVNMSRGSVVDEEALYTALSTKSIAGAAIDVWYNYQPESDETGKKYPYSQPFHTLDNVVLSPHRGASPMNDLFRWNEVIENITRFAKGKRNFLNQVDLERGY